MFIRSIAALALVAAAGTAGAGGDPGEQKVRDAIKSFAPGVQIDAIAVSQVPGFYEVVTGGRVAYVSADGKYLLRGEMVEIASKRELTAERLSALRKATLDAVPESKAITYAARDPKHTVTIFTDIDCGYCRKLHAHMDEYNDRGISVKYLFFPRAGLASDSFKKAVSVWCAADRNKALTDAKNGRDPESKTCDNPIGDEFSLGVKVGVTGTPAVYTESGAQIGGYLTPDQMTTRLEALQAKNAK